MVLEMPELGATLTPAEAERLGGHSSTKKGINGAVHWLIALAAGLA